MADNGREGERQLLVASMAAAGALGVLGVVTGILVGSQMILLDGVYSFVGIVLSGLLLWASALSGRGSSRQFPYGMAAATPLAIAIQAFVQLATLLYAAVEAVYTIRDGGSAVTAGWGIAYGVVVAASCVVVAIMLQRRAGHSDLLVSESAAWKLAAWRGAGMVGGFAVLGLLTGSRWSQAAPYIDPVMVIVSCLALLRSPLRLLRSTVGELLEEAPSQAISDEVQAAVRAVEAEFELDEPTLYTSKLGPKLYVEVTSTAGPEVTISQEHAVRESLRRSLEALPYEIWLTVELVPRADPAGPAT